MFSLVHDIFIYSYHPFSLSIARFTSSSLQRRKMHNSIQPLRIFTLYPIQSCCSTSLAFFGLSSDVDDLKEDPAMEWVGFLIVLNPQALDKNSDVHGSSYWILDERYERGSAFHGDDDNYQDASEARGWNQSRKSYRDE
ncbi:hypothetical protein LINPERHAP2_LOCUS33736 [Linum perenne]